MVQHRALTISRHKPTPTPLGSLTRSATSALTAQHSLKHSSSINSSILNTNSGAELGGGFVPRGSAILGLSGVINLVKTLVGSVSSGFEGLGLGGGSLGVLLLVALQLLLLWQVVALQGKVVQLLEQQQQQLFNHRS